MTHFTFDWLDFTEKDLETLNRIPNRHRPEDDIYGIVPVKADGCPYVMDIHYSYYGCRDYGFNLEVYTSDKDDSHKVWIGGNQAIKSATDYRRFRKRAEDLVIGLIRKYEEAIGKHPVWRPMTEKPDNECTCHVLVRYHNTEQGRTEYSTEPDTYAVELAKSFGHEPGFCKEHRWPERESMKAWCYFPRGLQNVAKHLESGETIYTAPDGYMWHAASEDPVLEGMYHTLIRVEKEDGSVVYRQEQDLYAVDIAEEHGHKIGFTFQRCKDDGMKHLQNQTLIGWARFPVPYPSLMTDATSPYRTGYRKPGWSKKKAPDR